MEMACSLLVCAVTRKQRPWPPSRTDELAVLYHWFGRWHAKRRGNGRTSRNQPKHWTEHRRDVGRNDQQPECQRKSPGACRSDPRGLLQWPGLRESSGDGRLVHQCQLVRQPAGRTDWLSQPVSEWMLWPFCIIWWHVTMSAMTLARPCLRLLQWTSYELWWLSGG